VKAPRSIAELKSHQGGTMDVLPLFSFFSQQVLLGLNPLAYASYLIANTILNLIQTHAPTLEQLKELLAKAGFTRVSNAMVERLWEEAGQGADALAEWIKDHKKDPEVSAAAGQIVASQAPEIGQALDQALDDPKKREQVAELAKEGFKELGEPTALLADPLAAALLDPAKREALAAQFDNLLTSHVSLELTAKKKSTIKKVKQSSKGSGAKVSAKITAVDGSVIEGIDQDVDTNH